MKILVTETPDESNCPFQIKHNERASALSYPPVCLFRLRERDLRDGLSFAYEQTSNCKVYKGKDCPYLQTLDDFLNPKE